MMEKYLRVCENGHTISVFDKSPIEDINFTRDEIPSFVASGPNFCPKCGNRTHITCIGRDCYSPIRVVISEEDGSLSKQELVNTIDMPSYCYTCGNEYPWITPVEKEIVRDGKFLDLNPNEVEGYFYQNIINEINTCYRVKANNATNILYRKLLENLIYDILLARYGPEEMELYFDKDNGVRLGLKSLVENLKEKQTDLKQFSGAIDDPQTIQLIQEFKQDGDSSAHTRENLISDSEIEDKSEDALQVARILFDLRNKVYTISE